jgi:hypothetical protein
MIAASYEFPTLTVNCVGADRAIQDLDSYFELHKQRVLINIFAQRIIANHVYCFMIGKTRQARRDARQFNSQFKANNLFMSSDGFDEALFVTHPDELSQLYGISNEQKQSLLTASVWKNKILE